MAYSLLRDQRGDENGQKSDTGAFGELCRTAWTGCPETSHAYTVVLSAVTQGTTPSTGGSGANPLDKVSQRKVVRDAKGYTYLVFTKRSQDTYDLKQVWIARGLANTWQATCLFGSGCMFGA